MLKILFIALAFLSGAVALSHELLWTRRLIDLLGATEAVTGRVLGLFFLGLSLGGWLATRWCRSVGNSGMRLGVAESAIALLSLPAVFLPYWADGLISAIGIDLLVAWQGTVLKLLIAAAVVLPPAIAMGTTMPMFIRVITDLGGTVRGSGIWIYAINMIGGVFGLWFVSTSLLELSGVRGAMLCTAAGNLVIAVVSFACSKKLSALTEGDIAPQADASIEESPVPAKFNRKAVFGLAFASGAIVLASEVLILRLLNLVTPSSLQTTSALLANVILFLALGSIAVAILNRFHVSSQMQLIIGALGAALFCVLCPIVLYQVTNQLASLRYLIGHNGGTIESLTSYWSVLFRLIAISSGVAMFFYGLIFPSIMSLHASLDPKGRSVGLLLAVNGVGGLLGAEIANLFLVTQIGIYQGFVIVAVVTLMLVLAICLIDRQGLLIAVLAAASCVAIFCFREYQKLTYLSPKTQNKFTIEETRFGRDGVLMVVKDMKSKSRSLLMNNQYLLGSTGNIATERRQLLLPWFLNQEAKDVCCIGLATGISASGLEKVKSPPNVTSVELSAAVAEIAEEFFEDQNGEFFRRTGNRVVIEDGRTFTACANREFDLIVADLFRPFGAGESRLFSLEHFQNAKRALRAEGLFCQWLPGHQLNHSHFKTIAATFQKVFPNTLVITGNNNSQTPLIGLCGWQDDRQWETQGLVDRIRSYRMANGGLDKDVDNPQLLIVGVLKKEAVEQVRLNTLDNAILEIDAGRFWITKDLRRNQPPSNLANGFLSHQNWKRFLIELVDDTDPVLDPIHRQQIIDGVK